MSGSAELMTLAVEQGAVVLDVSWHLPGGGASLYVLCTDAQGYVSSMSQAVYSRSPRLPGDGVVLRRDLSVQDHVKEQVQVAFELLGTDVTRLEFVVAASRPGAVLTGISEVRVALWDPRDGKSQGEWTVPGPGLAKRLELGAVARQEVAWTMNLTPVASDFGFEELFASRHVPSS